MVYLLCCIHRPLLIGGIASEVRYNRISSEMVSVAVGAMENNFSLYSPLATLLQSTIGFDDENEPFLIISSESLTIE